MARWDLRVVLCLFLTFGQSAYGFDMSFGDVTEMLRLGRETVVDVLESWELIRPKGPEYEEQSFPFVKRMERELKHRMIMLAGKIDVYQEKMKNYMDDILITIFNDMPVQRQLENKLRQFDQDMGRINDLYNNFVSYSVAPKDYERFTMEDFARTCVSSRRGALPDLLKNIHRLIVPASNPVDNSSILILLANQMQEASMQICNEFQSPQQVLYNLYTTIALAEIKGYSMIQFSYMLLRTYNQGSNFNEEMTLVKEQYATRTSEMLRAVKTAMAFAPRDIWRCDPKVHKLDETYTHFKELFQGYVVNEVDLNTEATCRENCAYYGYAKVQMCYKNQFCAQQRMCNGKILNCEYIDSDMWVCPAGKNTSRRYEYIEYENGRVFGQKGTCSMGTTKVDSWWRWLFWHCSYCFCYCDDQNSSSERYISLRKVMSDVANNRIITGIRMQKDNQILHIQIQEGELMPRGDINNTSIAWKPIDKFSILDKNVRSNVDYHALAWEKRALDLDDLVPAQDHILTGIRFRMVGTRVNLEIMVTPFNFTTGKLIQPLEKSFWHSNDNTDRTELELKKADIPIRSRLPSIPDSKINQYLNFAPSDREQDAAQNTIPFIDIQPIETKPPVPIAGAGIFHKGRRNSGGFVALKLIAYNFAPHLQVDLPPAPPIIDTPNKIISV